MVRVSPLWYLCIFVAFAAWVPVSYFRGELLAVRAEYAEYVAEAERASATAQTEARQAEQEWRAKIDEVQNNAKIQLAALGAALTRSDAASNQLREQLHAISERHAGDSPAADGSEATPADSGMLADMLGQLDELAGKFAEAADRSRIAGEACETAFIKIQGANRAEQSKR